MEPYIRDELVKRKQLFLDYFNVEKVDFQDKHGQPLTKPFVYCSKIKEFLEMVAMIRNKKYEELLLKVGLDSGQGHLRMTVTLFEERGCDSPPKKHRNIKTNFKDTGVKKVMIVATSPDVPESYYNISLFLEKVNTSTIWCTWTGDLKMANLMAGLMSCSSAHPCVYCETNCYKGRLGGQRNIENSWQYYRE